LSDQNLSIIIKTILASAQASNLDGQIRALSTQIKERLVLKLKIDASDLQVLTQQIDQAQRKLKTKTITKDSMFVNKQVEKQAFDEITAKMREVKKGVTDLAVTKLNMKVDSKGVERLGSAVLKYTNETGKAVTETMKWTTALKTVDGVQTKIRTFRTTNTQYTDNTAQTRAGIQKTLDKLQLYENKIAKLKSGFISPVTGIKDANNLALLTTQYNKIKSSIEQVRTSNTILSNEQRRGILKNISSLELEIAKYRDLQRVMTTTSARSLSGNDISLYQATMANRLSNLQVGKETVFARPEIQAQMRNFTAEVAKFGTVGGKSVKELNLQFARLSTSVRAATAEISRINSAADSFGTTLGKNFLKMIAWTAVATAIYAPFRAFQHGIETLKELDILMVDIAKVTNLSAEAMINLKNSSFEASNAFGRTAQDYLKSVGEFSRAGYEGKSEDLAKISLLAQNVGSLTGETANAFLLATDAAYKFKGSQEELGKVLDGVNQIDNRFATSIQKVSEGMTVVGSIAANAGVGVNELAAAVGTMTAATQRSGNEMGRAFRGILMNIRQVKGYQAEEGDIIDDEAISKSAKALDSVNIKVHELRNGVEELRNPMDVIKELAEKWETISTMDQSKLIEAIGGKYRGNEHKLLTAPYVQKCA